MYNYKNLEIVLDATHWSQTLTLILNQNELTKILKASPGRAATGRYLPDQEKAGKKVKEIVPTIPRHVAQMGYYCRLGTRYGKRYLQVWANKNLSPNPPTAI